MIPKFIIDSDDDWQEGFRATYYPWLNSHLESIGKKIGIPLYATGHVSNSQYIGVALEGEETIEEELVKAGFRRNPIACYKSLKDGRKSEGSWVLLHEDAPEYVEKEMQIHLTLFEAEIDNSYRELYAHYEDDWRTSWLKHLKETNFSTKVGVEKATDVINDETFLTPK